MEIRTQPWVDRNVVIFKELKPGAVFRLCSSPGQLSSNETFVKGFRALRNRAANWHFFVHVGLNIVTGEELEFADDIVCRQVNGYFFEEA